MEHLSITLEYQYNVLDGLICYEPVDMECFNMIMSSDLLKNGKEWNETILLSKYKPLINRISNVAEIKYTRAHKMSFGRCNPQNSSGMFQMRMEVRHTLASKAGFSDWDIENAHPQILLQICKANGLECSYLQYYCENRDTILNKLMQITKCNRKRAKVLFIRLLYFGKFDAWTNEEKDDNGIIVYEEISLYAFENDTEFLEWIENFTKELMGIGANIVRNNPELVKEIMKNKEEKAKKNFNKEGSVVSYFLQEYEVRILQHIYKYCCKKNYIKENVCVLCADGIMLENALIANANIPKEFHNLIRKTMGLNLVFTNKALDNGWTDEFLKEHQISINNLDSSKLKRFDTPYFNKLVSYTEKKIYFENFVTKVLRPDPVYIYIEEESDSGEGLCFYSQSKLTDTFRHLNSAVFCSNHTEKKFITVWLDDENIKLYNKMDFLPFNDRNPISPDIFNLFRGFNKNINTKYDASKSDKILTPFFDLGKELCGGDDKNFDYLLKYIADIIQNPQKKNPIAFIIKGKQGTGKNVWLDAVGNILGMRHFITSSNAKDFFGDYAEGFYHKLLVNMNECEGKDTFDFEGRIKSFITEDKITLNRKFVQPITILNLARLIIFTNKSNPIPIDIRSKDRRYVVYDTTDKYLSPKYGTIFWTKLVKYMSSDIFVAALYNYLNTMDLEGFDWRTKRPITTSYLQMCKLYVPAEILFLENKLVQLINKDNGRDALSGILNKEGEESDEEISDDEGEKMNNQTQLEKNGILGQQLYKEYVTFCKEWGFYKDASYQKTLTKFYSKLAEFELPMHQKKQHNVVTFYFSMKEVMEFMKSKNWIDRSDEDFTEETEKEIEGEEFTDYFTF
tara:strand:- start:1211 stop:3763 length:2553 start_codon:yes stop_codon:yes gene_type:complete